MSKIYVAHCIEHGERFVVNFKTARVGAALREIGEELASEWGGECTSVREWKPVYYLKLTHKKTGKEIRTTVKKWDAWRRKYLDDCLNSDARNPYTVQADGHDAEPADVYDYDAEKAKAKA